MRQILILTAAAAAIAPAGCNVRFGNTFDGNQEVAVPHQDGSALSVESGNGSVTVRKSTRDDVLIQAQVRASSEERLAATRVTAERGEGGKLNVGVAWPGGDREGNEGCSFVIELPEAVGVTVATTNGSVALVNLSGPARVNTTNGSVEVTAHAGPVTVETSNGGVKVIDPKGPVGVKSSNGPIEVKARDQAAYPVKLSTSNGAIDLEVGPAFRGSLSARNSNGPLQIEGPDGAEVNIDRNRGEMRYGEGPESELRTSNGRVRVRTQS